MARWWRDPLRAIRELLKSACALFTLCTTVCNSIESQLVLQVRATGAELDLLVKHGRRRPGFEFKWTVAPKITRSMRISLEVLRLSRLDVVHAGDQTYPLAERIGAVAASRLIEYLKPLA